jgi:hypothetical protein
MKTKRQQHFHWDYDPADANKRAELYAKDLYVLTDGVIPSSIHVWRDPAGRRTTVEWIEER